MKIGKHKDLKEGKVSTIHSIGKVNASKQQCVYAS